MSDNKLGKHTNTGSFFTLQIFHAMANSELCDTQMRPCPQVESGANRTSSCVIPRPPPHLS
jgi:hypothetical protein